MELLLLGLVGGVGLIAITAAVRKRLTAARQAGATTTTTARRDNELHRVRAASDAQLEEHDIDDMLGAIAEYRRRRGARDIGEELADELIRGTWDD
jgi:hypothetical protein